MFDYLCQYVTGKRGRETRNARVLRMLASAGIVAGALIVSSGPSQAWTIDFEDSFLDLANPYVNGIVQGRLMDDEFETAGRIGDPGSPWYDPNLTASIKALKPHTSQYSNYERPALLFDSNNDPNNEDPDLQSPFYNLSTGQWLNPGKMLIIHEDPAKCRDSAGNMVNFNYGQNPNVVSCDNPDDLYARPAGRFIIEFNKEIRLDSIDFFDIEEPESDNSEILLFDLDGNQILDQGAFYTPDTGGNNKWAQVDFGGIEGVAKLEIRMGGSGALDNIRGHGCDDGDGDGRCGGDPPSEISEPSTIAALLVGLGGLVTLRRRRQRIAAETGEE